MQLAGEGGGEVEAEPVDVHLLDPVAQAVHEQLQHVGVPHVEGIAGPRVVHVEARVLLRRSIIGEIIDSLEGKHGSEMVALGGVVEDHVEEDLDVRLVQVLHHLLELLHLLAPLAARGILVVRGEEADRVVPPVVAQPLVDQLLGVDELVDGEKLDRRHAKPPEVVDGGTRGEPQVLAAQVLGDVRLGLGESLDVHLVDDGVVPGVPGLPVVVPVEVGVGHDRARREGTAVRVARRPVQISRDVGVERLVPLRQPFDRPGVGVEKELGGIAALALGRHIRSVDAEPVALPWPDSRPVAVPDEAGAFGKVVVAFLAVVVEEAQLDPGRRFGEQREVGAVAVVAGAEGDGATGAEFHAAQPSAGAVRVPPW